MKQVVFFVQIPKNFYFFVCFCFDGMTVTNVKTLSAGCSRKENFTARWPPSLPCDGRSLITKLEINP